MKFIRKNLINIILIFFFLGGLCLLLYPTVSDYWNSLHQSRAIASYNEAVASIDTQDYEAMLEAARQYNTKITQQGIHWQMSDEEKKEYSSLLDVSGTGIIGYIEVDKIQCSLPIYHGTDEGVLQIAIGHLEGTSLPVGGEGTHCTLSGHRGLPSAKLFTDLDQMVEGDTFVIRVLDETLTYEVDQIRIVEPHETSFLEIEEGRDLCTLMTCTPYGVNTHRLLVRGHRIANTSDSANIRVTADAIQIQPTMVAPIVGVFFILLLLIVWMCRRYYLKKRNQMEQEILSEWNSKVKSPPEQVRFVKPAADRLERGEWNGIENTEKREQTET